MKKSLALVFIWGLFVIQACKKDHPEQEQTTSKRLHATRGQNPGIFDAQGRFIF